MPDLASSGSAPLPGECADVLGAQCTDQEIMERYRYWIRRLADYDAVPQVVREVQRATRAEAHSLYHAKQVIATAALRSEVEGLRLFKAGVDAALNSGDGAYRP